VLGGRKINGELKGHRLIWGTDPACLCRVWGKPRTP